MESKPLMKIWVSDDTPVEQALKECQVACVAAHQDDIELLAMPGILSCYKKSQRHFLGVVVSDGRGAPRSGVYADYSDEDMVMIRSQEQQLAAKIGEYRVLVELFYPSSSLQASNGALVDDLQSIFDQATIDTLYTHNPFDRHQTHINVLRHVMAAWQQSSNTQSLQHAYGSEVWRSLDWLPNAYRRVLPLDHHLNIASALIAVFDSQITGGKRYDLASLGRWRSNATFSASHQVDQTQAHLIACDLLPVFLGNISLEGYLDSVLADFARDCQTAINKTI